MTAHVIDWNRFDPPWNYLGPSMQIQVHAIGMAARAHYSGSSLKVGDLPMPYHQRPRYTRYLTVDQLAAAAAHMREKRAAS
jgi:hypothetical protein